MRQIRIRVDHATQRRLNAQQSSTTFSRAEFARLVLRAGLDAVEKDRGQLRQPPPNRQRSRPGGRS